MIRYLLLCVTSSDLAAAIMGGKYMTAHAGNMCHPRIPPNVTKLCSKLVHPEK